MTKILDQLGWKIATCKFSGYLHKDFKQIIVFMLIGRQRNSAKYSEYIYFRTPKMESLPLLMSPLSYFVSMFSVLIGATVRVRVRELSL